MAEKYKWTEVGLEIWKRKKKKGRVVWPEIGAVAVAPRDPSSAYKNARVRILTTSPPPIILLLLLLPFHYTRLESISLRYPPFSYLSI